VVNPNSVSFFDPRSKADGLNCLRKPIFGVITPNSNRGTGSRGSCSFLAARRLHYRVLQIPSTKVTCWAESFLRRVVSEELDDLRPVLPTDRISIVFPSLNGLIRYAQDFSHLHVRQTHVDALASQMLTERLGCAFNTSPLPPIH